MLTPEISMWLSILGAFWVAAFGYRLAKNSAPALRWPTRILQSFMESVLGTILFVGVIFLIKFLVFAVSNFFTWRI